MDCPQKAKHLITTAVACFMLGAWKTTIEPLVQRQRLIELCRRNEEACVANGLPPFRVVLDRPLSIDGAEHFLLVLESIDIVYPGESYRKIVLANSQYQLVQSRVEEQRERQRIANVIIQPCARADVLRIQSLDGFMNPDPIVDEYVISWAAITRLSGKGND